MNSATPAISNGDGTPDDETCYGGSHYATWDADRLLQDCQVERTKRGGPGGQHRNKTESAIVLTHRPSGVVGQAGEKRSQHQNREVAIERLRINLALAIRTEIPSDLLPSLLWRKRTSQGRLDVNRHHADFPAMLAELLDFLAAMQFELVATAQRLGVSSSQIVKFLKVEPAGFHAVNRARLDLGLNGLK